MNEQDSVIQSIATVKKFKDANFTLEGFSRDVAEKNY